MKRIGIVAIALGVLALAFNFFVKDQPSELLEEPLQETEASRVVVEDRKISVLSSKGTKAAYVPSSGHVVVSTKKDGQVDIHVKQAGLSLQAGFGGIFSDTARLSLDLQLAYWRRIGAHCGVAISDAHPAVVPFFAASYRLDQLRLSNTSLLVGVTTRKEPLLGLRLEF